MRVACAPAMRGTEERPIRWGGGQLPGRRRLWEVQVWVPGGDPLDRCYETAPSKDSCRRSSLSAASFQDSPAHDGHEPLAEIKAVPFRQPPVQFAVGSDALLQEEHRDPSL